MCPKREDGKQIKHKDSFSGFLENWDTTIHFQLFEELGSRIPKMRNCFLEKFANQSTPKVGIWVEKYHFP